MSKRSDGFNWYFSIYLNPSAQIDLLNRVFKEEFKNNQIIYSTHSPYMIDSDDFKTIRIVEKKEETKIFNNIPEYYKENDIKQNEVDLLTPVLTSLQLSVSNSLILDNDCIPILVEGLEDHYLLNAMIKKVNYTEKMKKFKIVPCIGVDKVPQLYAYLYGLGYTIIVLFDGDKQGENVIKKLKKDLKDIDNLKELLLTYSIAFDNIKETKLEDLLAAEDSQKVNHEKSLTYKAFFDDDNLKLNVETINNFKNLFDKIISFSMQ